MKEPDEMSVAELRAELRAMGMTDRLGSLILREMGEAEQRLEQSKATVSLPKGTYTLKGAVCSESNCAPFTKEITID